jgi:glycosyltransferase involved in cell wall biosynthesis
MTRTTPSAGIGPLSVAFILVSYKPDEPAGMERAVAALASGLRKRGHQAFILTAAPQDRADRHVITLEQLRVRFPCDDAALRTAIKAGGTALASELDTVLVHCGADIVVYVDALWGLGSIADSVRHPARTVLAVHVLGHDTDLRPALAAADAVIAPSAAVAAEAAARGFSTGDWTVVPNPLLVDPEDTGHPGPEEREQLRRHGPVRVAARLGPEKGVAGLLAEASRLPGRRTEVVVTQASFEPEPGSQAQLLAQCLHLAQAAGVVLLPALRWSAVPAFLAGAAITIVPSVRETFGNLALESLSAGTPVVAYRTGNLPCLLGPDSGVLVPLDAGPAGLREAARELLGDPVRYHLACRAAYCRSRNYRSADVADAFVEAVR